MDPWSLPKARPISCNDSPAFQRRHMSVLCSAESLSRLPCVINTTFRKMIHIRWCCIDRLSWHDFAGTSRWDRPATVGLRADDALHDLDRNPLFATEWATMPGQVFFSRLSHKSASTHGDNQ